MAGIEQAAQFFGLGQVGVHLVQEQGGLGLVGKAEEDGCGEVFGADRPGHQGGDNVEGGGFAATGFGDWRLRRGVRRKAVKQWA